MSTSVNDRAIAGDLGAKEIIRMLDLQPHPEGGWYKQTFQDEPGADGRAKSTCIYFLLEAEQVSVWHRVDAVETWHWYAGAPISISLSPPAGAGGTADVLGAGLRAGGRAAGGVAAGGWGRAGSLGAWTLVGCTVAPGFRFEGFEMAAPDWSPSKT